jgi:outer membrane protein TolC
MVAALAASVLSGCKSAGQQRESADRAVYEILEARRAELGADIASGDAPFTIEPPPDSLRQRLLRGEEVGPVDLVDCISIAAENSRDYRTQKEALYLAALDLTLERYAFQVQKEGEFGALIAGTGGDVDAKEAGGDLVLTKLLGTGARIVGNVGLSLARSFTSGEWNLTSDVGLAITQPLLRGSGERIVREPLTQAERDVVYEVRAFERFRRTFAFDVASRYYRILQQLDVVANEERNAENLQVLRERNEELARAGRLSDIQVDQARQDELRSQNNLIEQRQRLATQLDAFKLFLGLPIDSRFELEPGALEALSDEGEDLPDEARAIEVALRERLDYLTALDQVDDRARKCEVAADALRAGLDVAASASATSKEDRTLAYDLDDASWSVSAALDLPLDRIAERNAYRASLIALEATRRSSEELADSIQAALRASLREAASTRETLEIQRGAVTLAERRVESTRLNLDAGRADTRDILESQEALLEAQNAVTAARIDYHLARLALWRDVEALRVDEAGLHVERALLDGPPSPEQESKP